jgi:hypothetical protein
MEKIETEIVWPAPNTDSVDYKTRVANRRAVRRAVYKTIKWTMIVVGAVTIAGAVKNKTQSHEDCEV